MLWTNRQIVAAVLFAAGMAGVGAMAGAQLPAADDQEKQAREALQKAEAQLRAAEAQVKVARANYEKAKSAQIAKQEAPLRQRLQSVEWTLEEIRPASDGIFTLKLNHVQRLYLSNLIVARDAKVSIDNVPGKIAHLKAGMRLGLRLSADDLVVTGIDAVSPEELPEYLVKEVDVAKKTLSVTRAGKDFLTGLFVGDAEVYLPNDEDDLTALKPGMKVSLSFVASGSQLSVRKIQVRK
jgi:hypothetical protein